MFVDEVDVRQAWTFGCTTSAKPRPLFTDGALECDHDLPKAAMGGAILLSPSQQAGYFGRRAPCSHEPLESRQQGTRQRTGGTLRVHVTLKLWKPLLESQKFILLVDNYGAQDSLIEGWAAVLHWRKLWMTFGESGWRIVFTFFWVARVPSH